MSKRWYAKVSAEIINKQELSKSIEHLWDKLDETWDGDERPEDWDTTCEAMAAIMEEIGIEYNEYGTLI